MDTTGSPARHECLALRPCVQAVGETRTYPYRRRRGQDAVYHHARHVQVFDGDHTKPPDDLRRGVAEHFRHVSIHGKASALSAFKSRRRAASDGLGHIGTPSTSHSLAANEPAPSSIQTEQRQLPGKIDGLFGCWIKRYLVRGSRGIILSRLRKFASGER